MRHPGGPTSPLTRSVAVTGRSEYRIEHDSMGEARVPADAKWRAHSGRAVEN
ncbi:hypothetical protein SAZ11_25980 [Streptomyces sp. FXJ1.4098]|nr:hypothetical protein [Streptomyces sp. FXJ1.4098]